MHINKNKLKQTNSIFSNSIQSVSSDLLEHPSENSDNHYESQLNKNMNKRNLSSGESPTLKKKTPVYNFK